MQRITNYNLLILVLILQLLLITIAFSAVEEKTDFKAPDWFKQSFLDLQDDLDDANDSGKNIMLYFHQDGCPYCKKLLQDNFSRTDIVNRMKQDYEVLEINMWGDKAVTDVGGNEYSEKEFAKKMQVMFTPTLLILDKNGLSKFRINGYYSPDKFMAVLDYLELKKANKTEQTVTFTEYFRKKGVVKITARAELQTEKYIIQTDNLQKLIRDSQKPVMILFEQNYCQDCDEVHGDLFRRLPIYKRLQRFTIAQIDINSSTIITTPSGEEMTQKDFSQTENIQYTPSIYFYESANTKNPIFRSEAYLRGFHLETVLDYVSSNAYKTELEFQRFVQRSADEMAENGIKVDLWK